MTQTQKITGMILMAAGMMMAQQPAARMQEGAVCGLDANGSQRVLRRETMRDMNGRTQVQWTCLSEMERNPAANSAYGNYNQQPPAMPAFEAQYQQYQQAQPAYNNPPVPYNAMPRQVQGKVGKAFQFLQKTGQRAELARQLYYTR